MVQFPLNATEAASIAALTDNEADVISYLTPAETGRYLR